MSIANFVPTVWTETMLRDREKRFVAIKHCNRNYEGDIKDKGDKVKILTIGDIYINDYTKNNFKTGLELQTLDDESTMLEITESKYFNFAVDDVDKAQSNQNLMKEAMRKSGLALNDVADQFIFKKYTDAGITVAENALTSANIISVIAKGLQALYTNNVPEGTDIVFEVSPEVYIKMVLAKIFNDTDNSKTLTNGKVGRFLNTDIYLSNNIQKSGNVSHCLMRTKESVSYAEQLTKTKAYELGGKGFGDAVKGLMLYGAKVVKPKELVRLDLTVAEEATI